MQQAKIKNKNKSKASGQVSILVSILLTSRMTISRSPQGPGGWRDLILAQGKTEYLLQGRLQLQGRLLLSPDTRAE